MISEGLLMCLFVGPEVVLANLLSQKSSVSISEIIKYCDELKKALSNIKPDKCVYIKLNDKELETTLIKYESEFRFFQGHYYLNNKINLQHFNARFDSSIASTMKEVAQLV